MSGGSIHIDIFTRISDEELIENTLTVCERISTSTTELEKLSQHIPSDGFHDVSIKYNSSRMKLWFDLNDQREPRASRIGISGIDDKIGTNWANKDDPKYQSWMNNIFEFICHLSVALEADYVATFETAGRGPAVLPPDRPIGDNLEAPPRLGVFADHVVDRLGGLNQLYGRTPWYTAQLGDEWTVVVESSSSWPATGWTPPTDADYLSDVEMHPENNQNNDT